MSYEQRIKVTLPAEFGHCDITPRLEEFVEKCGLSTGLLGVSVVGSTGAVTTIEYESGALADLRRALDRLAPRDDRYEHNERWGDGNGFSHVRSALLKTGVTVPFVDGQLQLGTWQQVIVINLDNRDRTREVVAVALGSE